MSNELIAILILLIAGAFALYLLKKALSLLMRVGKKGADYGVSASLKVANDVGSKIEALQKKKLKEKLKGVVSEEIIRELTRRAIKKRMDLDLFDICNKCKGTGCSNCDNGWKLKRK